MIRLKMKNKNVRLARGFTIVELLIVIVIIGILAAIVIVSYIGLSKKATEASLTSDLDGAKRQLELYKTEHETYPTTMDANKCPTDPSLKLTRSDITFEVTSDNVPMTAVAVDPDWVSIGTQKWAKANLDVGIMIAGVTTQTDNSIVEKYCYDNDEANCTTYGALYQWDEAMNYGDSEKARGICPVGSHIPSDDEWKILEIYLGMTQEQADAEGDRGTDQAVQMRTGGTSGLNVLSGGYVAFGGFSNLSWVTSLWSSAGVYSYNYFRQITPGETVYRHQADSSFGFSVRCLKD
ncbi:hypothetical protein CVV43_01475 [Candidatus Saccharibacteria bacterium HGW-Saccharibacteria-1]|nr:MAG: hypothetical protein CVV43_01475 [Candidatus Saccharibacteria bacterium HGW-Saccharibacteria-1]